MPADQLQRSVAIIGGGVSGITTALLLQLRGISTTLYTRESPTTYAARASVPPSFATPHAAASILPHSVRSSRMNSWTRVSREYFRMLAFRAEAGVRVQTHYELFEETSAVPPSYATAVDNFEMLDGKDLFQPGTPHRRGATNLAGWRFDAYFCEAPTYLRYLYRLYEALGGSVCSPHEIGIDGRLIGYLEYGHSISINCTGMGSTELLNPRALGAIEDRASGPQFEPLLDPWEPQVQRGHYIRVALPEPLLDARGRFLSYNYTPTSETYRAEDHLPADVYCYPRSDTWVLGGSRQLRRLAGSVTSWTGDPTAQGMAPFEQPDGSTVLIPRPIFSLNAELIEAITNGTLSLHALRRDRPGLFFAGIGYRFTRSDPDESVRLAPSRIYLRGQDFIVIHNYGHGGAGFTLSWGCALDVLRTISRLVETGWPSPPQAEVDLSMDYALPVTTLTNVTQRLLAESEIAAR